VSLLIAGAFFVFMSYVEVAGTSHLATPLSSIAAPLNVLAKVYGVSWFRVPVSLCAMISFFSLTLSCLNSGSRIIYPMAHHRVFHSHLSRTHHLNRTPHVAISIYMAIIVTVPLILEAFTNPLTIFGDAGTLAAFGFLLAYFMITIAAPVYLKRIGELRASHVVMAVAACVLLLVPTIGSFVPVPPYPVRVFPYVFLAYMLVGSAWLYVAAKRKRESSPRSARTWKRPSRRRCYVGTHRRSARGRARNRRGITLEFGEFGDVQGRQYGVTTNRLCGW